VLPRNYQNFLNINILQKKYSKLLPIVIGAQTRKFSAMAGIAAIKDNDALVIIHDAVRPLVSQKVISTCLQTLNRHEAVTVTSNCTDTIYELNSSNQIEKVHDRNLLRCIQTPQAFKINLIRKAYELDKNYPDSPDDCSIIHKYKLAHVHMFIGDNNNIKISYPEDLQIIREHLRQRE